MLDAQEKEHDVEVLTLKSQIGQLQADIADLNGKMKVERMNMMRTVTNLKEKIEKGLAEKANLEQARLGEVAKRKAARADVDALKREAEERHKSMRQRDMQLSDNDAQIRELERSRR